MKQNKKKLYENIMASVAKEVKKALNEDAMVYNKSIYVKSPNTFALIVTGTGILDNNENEIEAYSGVLSYHNLLNQFNEDFIISDDYNGSEEDFIKEVNNLHIGDMMTIDNGGYCTFKIIKLS